MSETTLSAGWGVPICSKKWHYFAAGSTFSLCRKVGFYSGEREAGNDDSADNCVACKRLKAAGDGKAAVPVAVVTPVDDEGKSG
jgi:hypothetical protein